MKKQKTNLSNSTLISFMMICMHASLFGQVEIPKKLSRKAPDYDRTFDSLVVIGVFSGYMKIFGDTYLKGLTTELNEIGITTRMAHIREKDEDNYPNLKQIVKPFVRGATLEIKQIGGFVNQTDQTWTPCIELLFTLTDESGRKIWKSILVVINYVANPSKDLLHGKVPQKYFHEIVDRLRKDRLLVTRK